MKKSLTIENLNSAYVTLIKMVLNGSYPVQSPHINLFYHNPSPSEAYQLLLKVIPRQAAEKIQISRSESSQTHSYCSTPGKYSKEQIQAHVSAPGLDERFGNSNGLKLRNKNLGQGLNKKDQNICQNKQSNEGRVQKIKHITSKITQIFANNNKKVIQYSEATKNPVKMRPQTLLAKHQVSFKKI